LIIAHVITRLLRAGAEENTIETCIAQAKAGHQVVLIHGNEWNRSQAARCKSAIQLIEIPQLVHSINPRRDFQAVRAMRAAFRQLRPVVVHTHQSKAGIIGRLAARLARVPVIVHGVHIVPFASVGLVQRMVYVTAERALAGSTDAFINVSEGTRKLYLQHAVGRPEQHFVAHSGFDIERFQQASPPPDWRDLCGLNAQENKPPVVLMLAALEQRKRHIPFLECMHWIIQRVPNVKVLLAGEGPMRGAIEDAIGRLGLQNNVRLLGYNAFPERLIALADLVVLTSLREGLPRVIVQSLAGGTPVVTTALPGVEELVEDGVNGLITPAEDLSHTAEAMADLLSDSERLAHMQARARQTDVSTWNVDVMCTTVSGIYQRLIPASA